MTLWQWALAGALGWMTLSLLVSLGIAAALGRITKLDEVDDDAASEPLARERVSERDVAWAEDEEAIVAAFRGASSGTPILS